PDRRATTRPPSRRASFAARSAHRPDIAAIWTAAAALVASPRAMAKTRLRSAGANRIRFRDVEVYALRRPHRLIAQFRIGNTRLSNRAQQLTSHLPGNELFVK